MKTPVTINSQHLQSGVRTVSVNTTTQCSIQVVRGLWGCNLSNAARNAVDNCAWRCLRIWKIHSFTWTLDILYSTWKQYQEFTELSVCCLLTLHPPKSTALPPLILHSLFPLLFAFQGPTSSYNYRQFFISPTLVHAVHALWQPLYNLICKKLVKVFWCPGL